VSQDDLADIFHVSRDDAHLRQAEQLDEMTTSNEIFRQLKRMFERAFTEAEEYTGKRVET
jgi:TPP-dependent trihydroxycyclohexane-1,2-dione (THcHDO) dehydratase